MSTDPRSGATEVAPWRAKLQALFALALFSGGLVFAAYLFGQFVQEARAISTYQAASECPSAHLALDSTACRFDSQARVLAVQPDQLRVTIAFENLSGRSFNARFFQRDWPVGDALTVGTTIMATLWDGHVTSVASSRTTDSPESASPNDSLLLAAFFGLMSVIGLSLSVRLARIAWRREAISK